MTGQLVWLVTGASSGLGKYIALAALKRGDKVIATARARSLGLLEKLKKDGADTLELDVTASLETLNEVAKRAVAIHGRVDVLVNNAGYVLVGALEELTPEATLAQFNTNVFGALNVSRAFLPYMRAAKTGTVIWLGSMAGWLPFPHGGAYAATKIVTRSLAQSLHAEIAPLGLRSLCFELGGFRTSIAGNRTPYKSVIEDYKALTEMIDGAWAALDMKQSGDPAKAAEIMADFVRLEGVAKGKEVPTVVQLGTDIVPATKGACEATLKTIGEWEAVGTSTDFA